MANESQQQQYSPPPVPREPSLLAKTLGLPFKISSGLLVTLIISILIEWAGMVFFWPEQGAKHAEVMMMSELDYLGLDFKDGMFKPGPLIANYVSLIYRYVFIETGVLAFIEHIPTYAKEDSLRGFIASVLNMGSQYVNSTVYIVMTFILRLLLLLFAMPAFLMFIAVGMGDGLMQRDIRRWSGGRESSFVYHLAKGWVKRLIVAPWVVYLSLPWSVHPNFIILPFAVLAGTVVWITSSTFKKYL